MKRTTLTTVDFPPGEWTPTGWGARHRIRRLFASEAAGPMDRIEMVCHTEGNSVDVRRVNPLAQETRRCRRCELIPDLGPIGAPVLGEVRRDERTGVIVACVRTWDGRVPRSPADTVWLILDWGPNGRPPGNSSHRLDFYEVVSWPVIATIPHMYGSE
jgi:hypothetical protein